MKKLISLFLAMLMIFSVVTVAFAADDAAPGEGEEVVTEPTTEDPAEGGSGIEDMPLWQVKLIAKFGKIAVKIATVFVKIGVIFGIIEKSEIVAKIQELLGGSFGDLPIGEIIGIAI